MNPRGHISRRSYLGTAGAAGIGLVAGCTALESRDDRYDNVVLDEPERYEELRHARDEGNVAYPIYGDELPEVTVPDAISGREVSTTDFEGERHTMYTFVYVRCHAACPGLVQGLRHVQADSVEEGYADDIAFLPVTFDPEYDTPERLEDFGVGMGVDYTVDNWHFLRPQTEEDAQYVVEEQFGCFFERNPDFDGGDEHDGHDDEGDEHDDDDGMEMAWNHQSMTILANAGGYVERAYVGEIRPPDELIDDVRTLVERW